MRTQEKDIRRYFRKKVGCLVKEVILLRDKRTGNHKGCAYVQFGRIEDVNKAVAVSGQPPDFQRFPILVKPSEAEKNYVIVASSSIVTASMMGASAPSSKPLLSADGKLIEAQKVYIGSLDPSVTDEHIFALFSQFGQLEKVSLQMDPTTKTSRGFAFLSYRHPEEANLAIQTMSNQVLAGRAIKTGWASQTSTIQGVDIVTSDEFPPDAAERARKAMIVLAKMSGTSDAALSNATISATAERALDAALAGAQTVVTKPGSVPTVADARATLAAARSTTTLLDAPAAAPVKLIGGEENPTNNILVHNMFDKDQESGDDWPTEIMEEFEEECSKFGKITSVTVMSKEPGGKIYASFVTTEAATLCANNLAGRWFDKRQLRVDFMRDDQMPKDALLV
jgi:RNA-binding protein 39